MKSFKRFLTPLFICLFGFLLLTGCGSSNNTPAQSQKDAVLAALNAARKSNNVNVLSEDDQADIIAARIANAGIDYYCGNLTKEQFEKEFYSAGMTKINGKYFSEIYTGAIIPTKSSDFIIKKSLMVAPRLLVSQLDSIKNSVSPSLSLIRNVIN